MKCYSTNIIVSVTFLFTVMCKVTCLKCYQCSSIENRGCFTYNLNSAHLKDCSEHKGRPVCRSLSQINYFTPGQDVTMIRECAYVYTEPLKCEQSKFSNIHYSRVCECKSDGCNYAADVKHDWKIIMCALLLMVIK